MAQRCRDGRVCESDDLPPHVRATRAYGNSVTSRAGRRTSRAATTALVC
jgi:hypothetical protein